MFSGKRTQALGGCEERRISISHVSRYHRNCRWLTAHPSWLRWIWLMRFKKSVSRFHSCRRWRAHPHPTSNSLLNEKRQKCNDEIGPWLCPVRQLWPARPSVISNTAHDVQSITNNGKEKKKKRRNIKREVEGSRQENQIRSAACPPFFLFSYTSLTTSFYPGWPNLSQPKREILELMKKKNNLFPCPHFGHTKQV